MKGREKRNSAPKKMLQVENDPERLNRMDDDVPKDELKGRNNFGKIKGEQKCWKKGMGSRNK